MKNKKKTKDKDDWSYSVKYSFPASLCYKPKIQSHGIVNSDSRGTRIYPVII